jgi:hypothetical protein
MRECQKLNMLPVDDVQIESIRKADIRLGKSIYTKEQLEDFFIFLDSQGTRWVYVVETTELAYGGRRANGEWGLVLSDRAHFTMIEIIRI